MSSNSRSPLAPTTAIDHALDALASNDPERSLRWSIPALADEGSGAAAADVVGRALTAMGRDDLAVDAHELALAQLSHHGLVPHSVATALALRAITKNDDALKTLAKSFGAEANLHNEVKPPALKSADVVALGSNVGREALITAAVTAIEKAPRPDKSPNPSVRLPLWGALPSIAFQRFAKALTVRVCAPGEQLMVEGEPGDSTYIVARGELRVTRVGSAGGEPVELAVLGAGAIVGEMALVTSAPRAATVTATRGALVLQAPRAMLDSAAVEVPALGEQIVAFCHKRLVDNVMRTSAILREVPAAERAGLAQLFVARTFDPGDPLISAGANGAGLHLIAAGEVEVQHKEATGEVLRIATLGPGSCVGEISLVLRRPATASVIAIQPSVSLVLGADRFLEVIHDRPNLLAKLYELAVKREEETLTVVGQQAEEIDDAVIV